MRKFFSKIVSATIFALAITFTFSCTGGDDGDPNNGGTSSPSSSPSGGGSSPSNGGSTNNCTDATNCKTKKIGNRVWMLENLNINVGSGSTCYKGESANCDKYGRLYTWAAAMDIDLKYNEQLWGESDVRHQGICPTGWHIPSNDDWEDLIDYVEGENGCDDCAAKYLKSKSGWNSGGNGNDKYEFSALPGGLGFSGVNFRSVGLGGTWWGVSEYISDLAYSSFMFYYDEDVRYDYGSKGNLRSVRCVQD